MRFGEIRLVELLWRLSKVNKRPQHAQKMHCRTQAPPKRGRFWTGKRYLRIWCHFYSLNQLVMNIVHSMIGILISRFTQ